jgi:hypothetical protein
VYASDANAAAAQADSVAIAGSDDPALQARYPVAIARETRNEDGATLWMVITTTGDGLRALLAHGFKRP